MQKKLLCIASFCLFAITNTAHAQNYGKAGCGLGSMIWGKNGNQILAWTTNGTSANQLFGITSGTSNCIPTNRQYAIKLEQENYVAANYVTLKRESAQGQGETLKGLATVLGCTQDSQEEFSQLMKSKYKEIYEKGDIKETLNNIRNNVERNKNLSQKCTYASL